MAIPVYMFLGFLESGKTTLIHETLNDEGFNEGEKTLLLVFEEGIEEYSRSFLENTNTVVEYFEDLSEINEDILKELGVDAFLIGQSFMESESPRELAKRWKLAI